jgi:hypothetical protein
MGITHPPKILEMGYGFNKFQPKSLGTHPITHGSKWVKPVFRSLDEKDVASGANPLGTQRRSTPPGVGYLPYEPTDEKSSSWIHGPPVIMQLRWKEFP